MKTCMKNKKGITLIALIVTIIVLAITAAVVLNVVAGSNGILSKASKAVDETEKAQIKEDIELTLSELQMEYYTLPTRINYNGFGGYLESKLCDNYEILSTTKGGTLYFDEIGIVYQNKNGKKYDVSINDGKMQGIEQIIEITEDNNPPEISDVETTTNTIKFTISDGRESGVVAYAVIESENEPAQILDNEWISIEKRKKISIELTEKKAKTIYYIFAKDEAGNISGGTYAKTQTIDSASDNNISYDDIVWDGTNATVTFNTNIENYSIQIKIGTGEWETKDTVTVASGTAIYIRLSDGLSYGEDYCALTPLKESTITYNLNGGTGDLPNSRTARHTERITLDFPTNISKNGYSFSGWSTNSSASEAQYTKTENILIMGTTDITLYAVWQFDSTICTSAQKFRNVVNDSSTFASLLENADFRESMYDNYNITESIIANSSTAIQTMKNSSRYRSKKITSFSRRSQEIVNDGIYDGRAFLFSVRAQGEYYGLNLGYFADGSDNWTCFIGAAEYSDYTENVNKFMESIYTAKYNCDNNPTAWFYYFAI